MRAALLLFAALCAGACAVPNMVLPTGAGASSRSALNAPARAELVEIAAADGARLHGVWVPGEANAPVVLQLMEATVGATEAQRTHGLFWDLPGAGYATLAFDYRGVAASGGARHTDHVRADARAMWRDAVARAGGMESRVVLRGGSLGTLAIAILLQEGARPGAVVLYGPVRSETVVRRFMVTGWAGTPDLPDALAPWIALWFRRPLAVDLVEEIADCSVPILVICGAQDELLPMNEVELLRAATATAGGRFVLEDLGHVEVCTRHHRLHEEERAFLRSALPVAVDAEQRARAMTASMSASGVPALDAEAHEQLRVLVAERIGDPPAALAGLLLAGFDAERAARWLDEDRLLRGRWLTPLDAISVRGLAAETEAADELVLFGLARRIWLAPINLAASLMSWEQRGEGTEAMLVLRFEAMAGSSMFRMENTMPIGDLVELVERRSSTGGLRERLERLLRAAAGGVSGGSAVHSADMSESS
ncbi:MAG: alpha/beta hydrolase [Planctomycetota bacterium]|nr:alpha/beta hydrolase [Planctomycetota bacterium]